MGTLLGKDILIRNSIYGSNTNDMFGWSTSISGDGNILAVGRNIKMIIMEQMLVWLKFMNGMFMLSRLDTVRESNRRIDIFKKHHMISLVLRTYIIKTLNYTKDAKI